MESTFTDTTQDQLDEEPSSILESINAIVNERMEQHGVGSTTSTFQEEEHVIMNDETNAQEDNANNEQEEKNHQEERSQCQVLLGMEKENHDGNILGETVPASTLASTAVPGVTMNSKKRKSSESDMEAIQDMDNDNNMMIDDSRNQENGTNIDQQSKANINQDLKDAKEMALSVGKKRTKRTAPKKKKTTFSSSPPVPSTKTPSFTTNTSTTNPTGLSSTSNKKAKQSPIHPPDVLPEHVEVYMNYEKAKTKHSRALDAIQRAKIELDKAQRVLDTAISHARNTQRVLKETSALVLKVELARNLDEKEKQKSSKKKKKTTKDDDDDNEKESKNGEGVGNHESGNDNNALISNKSTNTTSSSSSSSGSCLASHRWNAMYKKLLTHKEKHGDIIFHRDVYQDIKHATKNPITSSSYSMDTDDETKELAEWVSKMRKCPKKQLQPWRREALDKIGFIWHQYEATWLYYYNQLVEFKNKHGHCLVNTNTTGSLGTWVTTQRKQYNRHMENLKRQQQREEEEEGSAVVAVGEVSGGVDPSSSSTAAVHSHMTSERIKLLEEVGFVWKVNAWTEGYNDLVEFKRKCGHFNVPPNYPNKKLRNFIATQRTHYRFLQEGRKTQLTEERIKRLTDIGFQLTKTRSDWGTSYAEMVQFVAQYGTTNVPYKHENHKLYRWANRQRIEYSKSIKGENCTLNLQQVEQLRSIGIENDITIENDLQELEPSSDAAAAAAANHDVQSTF